MSDYVLCHYGVLGMKWGIRRAARKATKDLRAQRNRDQMKANNALNKSSHIWVGKKRREAAKNHYRETKEKFDKSNAEYKKAYKKAKADVVDKLYSKQSREANKAVNEMSTGKAIVQSLLMGSYGALRYNESRTSGATRGKAVCDAVLANWGNNFTYGALSARKYQENRRARD